MLVDTLYCLACLSASVYVNVGSDYVSSDVVDKVPRETRKRQEAIFELVSTEKSYVDSLNLVKEVSVSTLCSMSLEMVSYCMLVGTGIL